MPPSRYLKHLIADSTGSAILIFRMMYYFYVLYSLKDGMLYKGSTNHLLDRILQHNNGRTPSTKNRRPLILLYFEIFDNKKDALARERWSKSLIGGSELRIILVDKLLLDHSGKLRIS